MFKWALKVYYFNKRHEQLHQVLWLWDKVEAYLNRMLKIQGTAMNIY